MNVKIKKHQNEINLGTMFTARVNSENNIESFCPIVFNNTAKLTVDSQIYCNIVGGVTAAKVSFLIVGNCLQILGTTEKTMKMDSIVTIIASTPITLKEL